MILKLFVVGDKFGVNEANGLKTLHACSELPETTDIDTNIPVFYIPEKVLKAWDGSRFFNVGAPESSLPPLTGQGIVDQNNDFEIMIDVPSVLQTATLKVLGLSFPSFFYTEYPAINGIFWSTNVNDAHTHVGSIGGNTGNYAQNHSHTYLHEQGGVNTNTSTDSNSHNHSFSANYTTPANTISHKHQTVINFSGSSQKTTFTPALLQIFIAVDRGSWGAARSIDVSSMFGTNGTGHIDITTFLNPGVVNYVRFHLNTATNVGGKISYLIKLK